MSGFAGNHICNVCVLFCVGNIFALFVFCIVENILAFFVFCFVKPYLPYLCLYCGKHIGLVFLKMRLFTHQQYSTSTKKVLWDLFWPKKEYITLTFRQIFKFVDIIKRCEKRKKEKTSSDGSWWWDKRLLICEKLLMLLCWLRKKLLMKNANDQQKSH